MHHHFKVQGATSWFFKGVKKLVQKMSLFEIQVEMWQKVSKLFLFNLGIFSIEKQGISTEHSYFILFYCVKQYGHL